MQPRGAVAAGFGVDAAVPPARVQLNLTWVPQLPPDVPPRYFLVPYLGAAPGPPPIRDKPTSVHPNTDAARPDSARPNQRPVTRRARRRRVAPSAGAPIVMDRKGPRPWLSTALSPLP